MVSDVSLSTLCKLNRRRKRELAKTGRSPSSVSSTHRCKFSVLQPDQPTQ
jgi:hypothetical protein